MARSAMEKMALMTKAMVTLVSTGMVSMETSARVMAEVVASTAALVHCCPDEPDESGNDRWKLGTTLGWTSAALDRSANASWMDRHSPNTASAAHSMPCSRGRSSKGKLALRIFESTGEPQQSQVTTGVQESGAAMK